MSNHQVRVSKLLGFNTIRRFAKMDNLESLPTERLCKIYANLYVFKQMQDCALIPIGYDTYPSGKPRNGHDLPNLYYDARHQIDKLNKIIKTRGLTLQSNS